MHNILPLIDMNMQKLQAQFHSCVIYPIYILYIISMIAYCVKIIVKGNVLNKRLESKSQNKPFNMCEFVIYALATRDVTDSCDI